MKDEIFNIPANKPRVLVAPLDWGLGHATRCIPVISSLIQRGCVVFVAAEAAGKTLLQKEFPDLHFMELKGYRMQYSRSKFWLPFKLAVQFPKLLWRIYAENKWLKKVVDKYEIDAVISDNRLGLSHSKIPCVYITHQLKIITGSLFTERLAQKIHYHFINKFKTCWVPDAAGTKNLAGSLSHPTVLPKVPVVYIGPLSRFDKKETTQKYECCIILSGPEPQRTVFENLILKDFQKISGNLILVRGLPDKTLTNELNIPGIEIKNHLPAAKLSMVLQQSKWIIARSGYTTIMDLIKLQKKALLVPTPGQTEQEYLASGLMDRQLFCSVPQKDFCMADAMRKLDSFPFIDAHCFQNDYEKVIEGLIKSHIRKSQ